MLQKNAPFFKQNFGNFKKFRCGNFLLKHETNEGDNFIVAEWTGAKMKKAKRWNPLDRLPVFAALDWPNLDDGTVDRHLVACLR